MPGVIGSHCFPAVKRDAFGLIFSPGTLGLAGAILFLDVLVD